MKSSMARRLRAGAFVAMGVAGFCTVSPCGSLLPSATAAEETEKPKKSVDAASVYFGDAKSWDKAAEVDPDKVYAKIEEYREIVEKDLKSDDPKYEILMAKASKRFVCAVKKAAKDGGYDLVAKSGSVKGVATVPDITADAIGKL